MSNRSSRRAAPPARTAPIVVAALLALAPELAFAYVGPGAGLTTLGAVVALVAAIGLAIVGFVWYPVKRLLRRPAAQSRPKDRGSEDE